MRFGLYFHIPYCLQKCHYCDFVTFDLNHQISPAQYTELILTELRQRSNAIPEKIVNSIYFGGGTPSLLPAEDILAIRNEIANVGFTVTRDAEFTIEINPGTIDPNGLDHYLAAGVNRFSVGVQTFNDSYLQACGREHSAETSRQTLKFLKERGLHYSFDLLFGLPGQTIAALKKDLDEMFEFNPDHVSLYNLTVPKSHPMNIGRIDDNQQAEMFEIIESALKDHGLVRYEISNFARRGFESRHNQLYWSDGGYWGLGVSAHSYLPDVGRWGTRFWNPNSGRVYLEQIKSLECQGDHFWEKLPSRQVETLQIHEALTDYCHTQLRMMRGLSPDDLRRKFGDAVHSLVMQRIHSLVLQDLLISTGDRYRLSPGGLALANQVFLSLAFLPEELPPSTH